MSEAAALLKAIAWPIVALTALIMFRTRASGLLSILAGKIDRSARVKITTRGIELAE